MALAEADGVPLPGRLVVESLNQPGFVVEVKTVRAARDLLDRVLGFQGRGEAAMAPPETLLITGIDIASHNLVEDALMRNPRHPYQNLVLSSTKQGELIDGSRLFVAALQCPTVTGLEINGFLVSAGTVVAGSRRTPLNILTLVDCYFTMTGDSLDGVVDRSTTCLLVEECTGHRPSSHRDEGNASFVRACDLAVAVSQANPVLLLSLEKTHLNARDLDLLCRMLTRTTCSVKYLKLGRGEDDDETPGLSDECLRLFFQSLPGMESLEDLTLHQVAPSSMSETILGGSDATTACTE
jgi:hypothetical protein